MWSYSHCKNFCGTGGWPLLRIARLVQPVKMNFYVIYKPKCLLCQHCGLFVDAVSLLDFFTCIGHVDAEKMLLSTASSILASPPCMKRAWLLLYKICSPWSSANQALLAWIIPNFSQPYKIPTNGIIAQQDWSIWYARECRVLTISWRLPLNPFCLPSLKPSKLHMNTYTRQNTLCLSCAMLSWMITTSGSTMGMPSARLGRCHLSVCSAFSKKYIRSG